MQRCPTLSKFWPKLGWGTCRIPLQNRWRTVTNNNTKKVYSKYLALWSLEAGARTLPEFNPGRPKGARAFSRPAALLPSPWLAPPGRRAAVPWRPSRPGTWRRGSRPEQRWGQRLGAAPRLAAAIGPASRCATRALASAWGPGQTQSTWKPRPALRAAPSARAPSHQPKIGETKSRTNVQNDVENGICTFG